MTQPPPSVEKSAKLLALEVVFRDAAEEHERVDTERAAAHAEAAAARGRAERILFKMQEDAAAAAKAYAKALDEQRVADERRAALARDELKADDAHRRARESLVAQQRIEGRRPESRRTIDLVSRPTPWLPADYREATLRGEWP